MKYYVIDTQSRLIVARFLARGHADDYVKYINKKLEQPNRHIVVEE